MNQDQRPIHAKVGTPSFSEWNCEPLHTAEMSDLGWPRAIRGFLGSLNYFQKVRWSFPFQR